MQFSSNLFISEGLEEKKAESQKKENKIEKVVNIITKTTQNNFRKNIIGTPFQKRICRKSVLNEYFN